MLGSPLVLATGRTCSEMTPPLDGVLGSCMYSSISLRTEPDYCCPTFDAILILLIFPDEALFNISTTHSNPEWVETIQKQGVMKRICTI